MIYFNWFNNSNRVHTAAHPIIKASPDNSWGILSSHPFLRFLPGPGKSAILLQFIASIHCFNSLHRLDTSRLFKARNSLPIKANQFKLKAHSVFSFVRFSSSFQKAPRTKGTPTLQALFAFRESNPNNVHRLQTQKSRLSLITGFQKITCFPTLLIWP